MYSINSVDIFMFYTFHRCIFAKTKMLKEWLLLLFQQKNEKELMFILLESSFPITGAINLMFIFSGIALHCNAIK